MTTTLRYWRTQRDHATCEKHLPRHAWIALHLYPGIVDLPHAEHDLTWQPTDRAHCDTCWWAEHQRRYN